MTRAKKTRLFSEAAGVQSAASDKEESTLSRPTQIQYKQKLESFAKRRVWTTQQQTDRSPS